MPLELTPAHLLATVERIELIGEEDPLRPHPVAVNDHPMIAILKFLLTHADDEGAATVDPFRVRLKIDVPQGPALYPVILQGARDIRLGHAVCRAGIAAIVELAEVLRVASRKRLVNGPGPNSPTAVRMGLAQRRHPKLHGPRLVAVVPVIEGVDPGNTGKRVKNALPNPPGRFPQVKIHDRKPTYGYGSMPTPRIPR